MVASVYYEINNIFKNKTYSISICQLFPSWLIYSFPVIEMEFLDNSYRTRHYLTIKNEIRLKLKFC